MATFISMYSAQAVLPQLAREFDVSPATSALAVSATTGVLAFAIVPASILSERFGRIRVMAASALVSALIGLLIPLAHDLGVVLAGRALQGLTLAGVPAVAMAYLAEEVDGRDLGAAMGRYIAGTTIGGLSGRLVAGLALVRGLPGVDPGLHLVAHPQQAAVFRRQISQDAAIARPEFRGRQRQAGQEAVLDKGQDLGRDLQIGTGQGALG